ncbi:MAG TPA: bifunctional phosphopantothenoylcysteine decarboxylase/phosphopantothenate--cysteine ligase CoaBC [bacterium]|nr:bifunctional phosphopantothenoylcysteine decarboxylase/phosphopantothenate--cysteine ligase CoaBC [bacterium]HOL48784.1 bifunctional phosphopantothenoylcysteine decarboxylase/phosphopantothenate--cysteine ligase CoaBC [bacterium]HPQ19669.1 bifunctional phosphopantothenoylcysteine decarboxylase/phosphopantothenate--cysteine ligase CoaBC [bacterium]
MKNILIGITAGIAIYKIPNLIRLLRKNNFNVKIIMTPNARRLINPIIFQSLTNNKVYHKLFDNKDFDIEHISLARWADLIVIAPSTANTINKIANGIADNLLLNVILSTSAKILIVPAMNKNMYLNYITQESIKKLKERGIYFLGPEEGELACGEIGIGKMVNENLILEKIITLINKKNNLNNFKILITAGACREKIDDVRFISNYSSGKQGYQIAKAAYLRGANVTLISGYSTLEMPFLKIKKVESAEEMFNAVKSEINKHDIFISAAAVSDFMPEKKINGKIKKEDLDKLEIKLKKTPDILSEIKDEKILKVGFAAETENIIENGIKKLKNKKLNIIVINDVSRNDIGFSSDYNQITIITDREEKIETERLSKFEIANIILDCIVNYIKKR